MVKEKETINVGNIITYILICVLVFGIGIIAGQYLFQKIKPDESTYIQKSAIEEYEITDDGIRLYTTGGLLHYDVTCKVKEEN